MSTFDPFLIQAPNGAGGWIGPFPGRLAPDGRAVLVTDHEGRFYLRPLDHVRIDIAEWRRARATAAESPAGDRAAIASRVAAMHARLDRLRKGSGKGAESFAATREALRSDLRALAELVDGELADKLWADVAPKPHGGTVTIPEDIGE